MNRFARTSCIILSAGGSGRMGMHKALLPFGSEKITFLEKISQSYSEAGFGQIVVVVNNELSALISARQLVLPRNVLLVINPFPESGRFHSLKTGMQAVTAGSSVFFQNIDNPFVFQETLWIMFELKDSAEVVLPRFSGERGHPVLLNPRVCDDIRSCDEEEYRIDHFLKRYRTRAVDTADRKILVNINTPEDYNYEFPVKEK